ncbi:MAG: hypothetical protein QOH97_4487 [Actinoplanes sp.]|nr:hypothetical protein [Actinoplanes sp.]
MLLRSPRDNRSTSARPSSSVSYYDPTTRQTWGETGDTGYVNNPMASVAGSTGDHLGWLRARLSALPVCGQGQVEDTTGALESTRQMARRGTEQGFSPIR